jgi:SUF system NifU family Fe-S assembly protein
MSDELYTRALLRLAADAHGAGHLEGAHRHGSAHNPACGDKVEIDVALAGGRIAALAHETKACVIAQASASILGRDAKGLAADEVRALRAAVAEMLAKKGGAPKPPFDAYETLEGAASIPGRHTCVLLPFDALLAAMSATDECGSTGT